MRVIDRLTGAWLGTAIAEEQMLDSTRSVSAVLQAQAQKVSTLQSIYNRNFFTTNNEPSTHGVTLANALLVSCLLHDADAERAECLQQVKDPSFSLLVLLSESLTCQLKNQSIRSFPMKSLAPESQSILTLIQAAMQQQLPLQEALSILCESPDLPEPAIAIALYCWYCTPQNFSISVTRAKKSLEYLQDLDSTHPPDYQWIPGLTGFLSGLSMGGDRLLHYPSPNIDRENCRTQAHQLFTVWAGINNRPQSNCQGDDAIILAPGILKPRESTPATE